MPSLHSVSPRASPEIAGSQGAFIAIVVVLSVVIMLSLGGIVYMIKTTDPKVPGTASTAYQYHSSSDPTSTSRRAQRRWFGIGPKKRTLDQNTTSRGWVQAGSGDEWEDQEDMQQVLQTGGNMQHRRQHRQQDSSIGFPYPTTPFTPISSNEDSPAASETSLKYPVTHFQHELPSLHARALVVATPPSHTQSPMQMPPRRESPEPLMEQDIPSAARLMEIPPTMAAVQILNRDDQQEPAADSPLGSLRTFTGGTKFVEQL